VTSNLLTFMQALAVRAFEIDSGVADHLLDLSLPATLEIKPTQLEDIVRTVDYAWLSDLKTTKFHTTAATLNSDAGGQACRFSRVSHPERPYSPWTRPTSISPLSPSIPLRFTDCSMRYDRFFLRYDVLRVRHIRCVLRRCQLETL
jgi:hypothetical protein